MAWIIRMSALLLLAAACGDDGSSSGAGGSGGSANGGASDGGAADGGDTSDGGAPNGGASDGGASNGGAAEGGASNGGGSEGGGGGGAPCAEECGALDCCDGVCVAKYNDIFNCGFCGNTCTGDHPYCNNGICDTMPPCEEGGPEPGAGQFCCGNTVCNDTDLCCDVPGPGPTAGPQCYPVNPEDPSTETCDPGCPLCQ